MGTRLREPRSSELTANINRKHGIRRSKDMKFGVRTIMRGLLISLIVSGVGFLNQSTADVNSAQPRKRQWLILPT